jgi:2,4-didehydro-3-deoxy-L-rhamnonate hydrolase
MRYANVAGRGAIVVGDEAFDVAALSDGHLPPDAMRLVTSYWGDVIELCSKVQAGSGQPFSEATLRSPVPAPRSIFGLVAN